MFLWLVSWLAVAGEFALAIFSLAAGLYYLAELIEEFSVLAKKVITALLVAVVIIYCGLFLFEGFPLLLTVVGLLTHLCFASLLKTFPIISLFSVGFIGGCVLLLVAHFLAFQHFGSIFYSFQEVLAFFFICLWVIPFSMFISLTANDMTLPTLDPSQTDSDGIRHRSRRSGFLVLFDILSRKITEITPSRSSKQI